MKQNDLIANIENPEWGTWRVIEGPEETGIGDCFVIRGEAGARVLFLAEFIRHWKMEKVAS